MPMAQAEATAPRTSGGDARHPVVVELFQSQGCSSCPPANANVNAIVDRDDILALSFAVTYWDKLGWKDTFAKPEYTQRQRDYAKRASNFDVATPQVVINGRSGLIGHKKDELERAIVAGGALVAGPSIERMGDTLVVGTGRRDQAARVLLVSYDPRAVEVPISAGENNGRTLPHRDVVHSLIDLGEWKGSELMLKIPPLADPNYKIAVLLQQGPGGPIVSARKF
ncbi:DUF1223 domain-containing protein [Sphingorhabdus soli]|uniref:DUF1223 domain-containing protein n=2 Tax=Flavisphingopyxis soli TaxID=2601267 RepID=A0A5C6U8B9_9SPHN|nr:DUF1223 domain-containing protein [Sphingorhabdus soli]